MPSSGTSKTGFCKGLGPYDCGNCQKFEKGLCKEKEVAEDPDVPKELKTSNGVIVDAKEVCCNEFLSLKDKQRWDGKSKMRSKRGIGARLGSSN